ncbi:RING finger protein 32 [Oryzias latipes]|uniref:RING finger protein 32 n=1 Tax=Oryzias latipes TaxID=8090 RepID=UPI0009DB2F8A|nr:RING finger protein 32 [Oryzias latipes]
MAMQKSSIYRTSNNWAITSAAFQDHIIRSLLSEDFSVSDPLSRHSRKSRKPPSREKLEDLKRGDAQQETKHVFKPTPPNLTLAQKLGLVASPKERLTKGDWMEVKKRSLLREESAQPCTICREEFRLQPQVLLCCSHVFHRTCLQAFERFSGRKRCPVCRREQYETRVIHDAARLFRHQCAIRIQAYWRGYSARKSYREIMRTKCPKDKKLRRRFFEDRLQELNDSFVRHCHTDTKDFLRDIDRSLSSSRRVFQQLEKKRPSKPQENNWDQIKTQVFQRGVRDCPICLTALWDTSFPRASGISAHLHPRPTLLLSCSHLFHQFCLEAFEAFIADRRPTCPLCRSPYHKKLI